MLTHSSHRRTLIAFSLLLGLAALLLWSGPVLAQQAAYRLNLSRDFGYSNGGDQVRGNFTASIAGPQANIQAVTYLIDGKSMGVASTSPFTLKFVTTDYPLGWHDLSAVVQTRDGQTVTTAVQRYEFASAAQESAAVRNIVGPLLGVVAVVIVAAIGIQVLTSRRRPKVSTPLGAARHYGINGGTICPKCHRPFALHWWALNAGITSKIDRCDYCGRYGFFKRYSREELAAAEATEQQMAQPETPIQPASAEQKLKEMLDESRYTDKS